MRQNTDRLREVVKRAIVASTDIETKAEMIKLETAINIINSELKKNIFSIAKAEELAPDTHYCKECYTLVHKLD